MAIRETLLALGIWPREEVPCRGLGELGLALAWSVEKFPSITYAEALDHAEDELSELYESVVDLCHAVTPESTNAALGMVVEEACDLAVMALVTALAAGATAEQLAAEVRRKLAVNKKRKWSPSGRHIEEDS